LPLFVTGAAGAEKTIIIFFISILCQYLQDFNFMNPFTNIWSYEANQFAGFVASSHHVSQSDMLNGYCLPFYTAQKDFNK
jgi:hypothetical protein